MLANLFLRFIAVPVALGMGIVIIIQIVTFPWGGVDPDPIFEFVARWTLYVQLVRYSWPYLRNEL